ncbi:MAG: aspartate/ornithine carbamoyltransferase family protein [Ferrimicrobium sp.]
MVDARSLVSVDQFDGPARSEIVRLVRLLAKSDRIEAPLRGYRVAGLFLEPSTRTRLAFEVAIRGLGGEFSLLDFATSSLAKGESYPDTLGVLEMLGFDCVVVRSRESGIALQLLGWTGLSVINAGDGAREHPTQALADVLVLAERWGCSIADEKPFRGRVIAIVGDVAHSRVARSVGRLAGELGARVFTVAPRGWSVSPGVLHADSLEFNTLDDVLGEVDVVYSLRIQRERFGGLDSLDERHFLEGFQINRDRLALLRRDAVVMHPGPVNRGVEVSDAVADDPRFLAKAQVAMGRIARSAVVMWVSGRSVDGR